jgi:hypothetical protein
VSFIGNWLLRSPGFARRRRKWPSITNNKFHKFPILNSQFAAALLPTFSRDRGSRA